MAAETEAATTVESGETKNMEPVKGFLFGLTDGVWYEGEVLHVLQPNRGPNRWMFRPHVSTGYTTQKKNKNNHVWLPKDSLQEKVPTTGTVRRAERYSEYPPLLPTKKSREFLFTAPKTQSYSGITEPARAECGLVGLKNQGATCYLNSLVQSLYMTPRLRKAVFNFSKEFKTEEQKDNSVPHQLQKLFANLQVSANEATDTKGLTSSFGWGSEDVFEQHDVVELATQLFSHLEEKSKDKNLIDFVKQSKVTTADYVKCLNCGTRRERADLMVAVSLNIENIDSLEDALSGFTKPEILDGDNKYMCSNCDSKQDAKKGIRFTAFKEYVAIQLNRWTLDWMTLERKKLRNKIRFPFILDVSPFLTDPSKEEDDDEHTYIPQFQVEFQLSFKGIKDTRETLSDLIAAVSASVGAPARNTTATAKQMEDNTAEITFAIRTSESEHMVTLINENPEEFAEGILQNIHQRAEQLVEKGEDPENIELVHISESKVEEQKNEYELYSMMIHRGGAYGGHYFAYIKDYKTNRWFEFNDSKVDEITADELEEMFDENCSNPSRDSPLTGAYMLLYRRLDPDNKKDIPNSLIPEEVAEPIQKRNAVWEKKWESKKRKERELNLKIQFGEQNPRRVKVDKTQSIAETLEKVRETLKIDVEIKDEDLRLRPTDHRKQPKTPLANCVYKVLADYGVKTNDTLLLEQKEPEAEFEEYKPSTKTFKVKFHNPDAEEFEFGEEIEIIIPTRSIVADLRHKFAEIKGVDQKNIKVFQMKGTGKNNVDPLDNNKLIVARVPQTLVVETCEDWTDKAATYKIKKHYEELSHQIEIKYKNFDGIEDSFKFDNRRKLIDLRNDIASRIGREPYSFVMQKESMYSANTVSLALNPMSELSKDNSPLESQGFRVWSAASKIPKIKLLDQDALKPGQVKVRVKLQQPEKLMKETFIQGNRPIIVELDWDLEKSRQFFSELLKKYDHNVEPDHIRIRKMTIGSTVSGFDLAMDETNKLGDLKPELSGQGFCLQILKEPETLSQTDRVCSICRWFPEKKRCSTKEEIVVDGSMKLKDGSFAEFLSNKFEIEEEHVRFQRAEKWKVENNMCSRLDWELEGVSENAILVRQPLLLKHGQCIVYKDNTEKEVGVSSTSYMKSNNYMSRNRYVRHERELKIHSMDDDDDEDEEENDKEEDKKEENDDDKEEEKREEVASPEEPAEVTTEASSDLKTVSE